MLPPHVIINKTSKNIFRADVWEIIVGATLVYRPANSP